MFPGLYWKTEREPATPFTTIIPLAMRANNIPDFQQKWRQEFMDSLRSARPRFLLISQSAFGVGDYLEQRPSDFVHQLNGFDTLLRSYYRSDTVIGDWSIYRRID
jgi:hypothetical protein